MSRSAADATRFTATAPHAYSKSGSTTASRWSGAKVGSTQGGSSQPGSGGVPGETPKQKVERLRAEARAARIAKSSSPLDRFIGKGRVWADRLHRITVFSIIAASATSLISHNRRQKALWIDIELQKLLDAKKAYVAGNATLEQIQLLEKEKAADEEKRRRDELKRDTMFYKAKDWLFGGLKRDDAGESVLSRQLETEAEQSKVLQAINAQAAEAGTNTSSTSQEGPRG
ncbi:predicted protein [Uncinocarpus reesii 1704]|uniref:Uncharacterized protein n=1 Tax=Uncinocarpus reesii (strain UAMH 1704) TaxID=336963 RepID=C4JJ25_UNCRE|nr:uncharacterized protein UREG_01632 [Uncinocarpus reesii 1704]EEP76783.1 predicted protein [Uncinocarpus reesii 1704]